MWEKAVWLGVPQAEISKWNILEGDMTGRLAYYRCTFSLKTPGNLAIDISANSRYRLWVNGCPVLSGPCKGDRYHQYYETVDVSKYLVVGKNVLTAEVLSLNPNAAVNYGDERQSILSVVSLPVGHRFAMEGQVKDDRGEILADVTTGVALWKVYLDGSFYLKTKEININLGGICEDIDFRKVPADFKSKEFDDSAWSNAEAMESVLPKIYEKWIGLIGKFHMLERPIPLLYEEESSEFRELGSSLLSEKGLQVEPHQSATILLDAGVIVNAYMMYSFHGGTNANIRFTYFERFENKEKKIQKSDYINGTVEGLTDEVVLAGGQFVYEPFWFRTFRFIRIEMKAENEPITFLMPKMLKTGYPLNPVSKISSSVPWVEQLWTMCVRTLQNCMTETYMDCPFYEQMQFPMDTRLQALYTYVVSADSRLAKKALEDFHSSMIPEGLIQGKYPCNLPEVISTFSLYYIFMLLEYYQQTGDVSVLKQYRSDVDEILEYYDRHIGEDGLVGKIDYWAFVDWQKEWRQTAGMPSAALSGPSTIINLMYAYALHCGAMINEYSGRSSLAAEYLERQSSIKQNIQKDCWDETKGLYREGPAVDQYSQHAQAWAVLNDLLSKEQAAAVLRKSMTDDTVIKCSFSTSYELFRALEYAGEYRQSKQLMDRWIQLIDLDCTTCPEEPENGRSECHAWSALPMYEFMRSMVGLHPSKPGWETVEIEPHLEYLPDLKGIAVTPKGNIAFDYRKEEHSVTYKFMIPEGLECVFKAADGSQRTLHCGENVLAFPL